MFVDHLKGIISWVLDGVTAIALLAAGIVCYVLYSPLLVRFRKNLNLSLPENSEVEAYILYSRLMLWLFVVLIATMTELVEIPGIIR